MPKGMPMNDDDALARFREGLAQAEKPKQLLTEADLIASAKESFPRLFSIVDELDRVVKESYDPSASVTFGDLVASPRNRHVTGIITAQSIGTRPAHAPKKSVPFRIQENSIFLGGSRGSVKGGKPTDSGAQFESDEQDALIESLISALLDFYQGR
jgi:hypothetical protein